MVKLRVFASRVCGFFRGLFGHGRADQELDEELSAHLELLVEENLRRGLTLDQSRRAARLSFGGVEQTKDAYREQRGLPTVVGSGLPLFKNITDRIDLKLLKTKTFGCGAVFFYYEPAKR